jgi:hypothetical protein
MLFVISKIEQITVCWVGDPPTLLQNQIRLLFFFCSSKICIGSWNQLEQFLNYFKVSRKQIELYHQVEDFSTIRLLAKFFNKSQLIVRNYSRCLTDIHSIRSVVKRIFNMFFMTSTKRQSACTNKYTSSVLVLFLPTLQHH